MHIGDPRESRTPDWGVRGPRLDHLTIGPQITEKMVGAEGFEPPSAGFRYGRSYLPGIKESSLQLVINCQQTLFQSRSITGARQSARLAYTPVSVSDEWFTHHFLRILASLFLRLIFFLRHFQRWLPRFFQAREPLFMILPL